MKYRIKIYALVDSHMFYTLNLEVYVEKQPQGPFETKNDVGSGGEETCKTCCRNVMMDNFFTSVSIVTELLKEVVGTLHKNK